MKTATLFERIRPRFCAPLSDEENSAFAERIDAPGMIAKA